MLGGLIYDDHAGRFEGLSGGTTGSYDSHLSSSINNRNIIAALNSVVAGDALAIGVSGSMQSKGSSGFDGGTNLLWDETNGMFNSLALNVTGAATFDSTVSGAAGTFDALAGTSLALQGGGITAAGAIAGATTIDGSGKMTIVGVSDLDGGIDVNGSNFTVSTAGAVEAASTVSGAAGTFDALAGTSLALQGGGITAAGAIAGATTIDGSGKMTIVGVSDLDGGINVADKYTVNTDGEVEGASFSDSTFTLVGGAGSGFTTMSGSGKWQMGNLSVASDGLSVTTAGQITGTMGMQVSKQGITGSNDNALRVSSSLAGQDTVAGSLFSSLPVFSLQGCDEDGQIQDYHVKVSGGILMVAEL